MSLPSRTSSVSSGDGRPDLSAIGKILGAGDDSKVPKLGKTRCYWALLTSDLDFLYLDPVLQHHMGPEHQVMLGTSLLSYLHPAELEQARKDLRGIVDSGTLFGSVTRVRFARLSHIRQLLGAKEPEVPEDAATFCSDDKYLALDLVINAAGEGLVLAFFHAIIDKQQKDDQDEVRKSEWTNWCGTPFITQDMIKLLWDKVSTVHLPPPPRAPAFPPQRVFQIHLASSEHEILLTHPPARPMPMSDGPPLLDGGYQEEEFQRLLEQISLNPQGGSPFSEAKTTCTRRFRAKHTLLTEGCFRTIESVFIPYGTLIFACFQTKHQEWLPPSAGPQAGPRPPQIGYNTQQHHQHQQQQQQHVINHPTHHNASPYPPPPPATNHSWNSQPAAAAGYGGAPPWPGTPAASTTSSSGPSGYGYSVSSSYGGDQHPYRVQHQQPGPPPPQQQQQHQQPHVLRPPPTDGYSQQRFESTSPTPGPEFSQDDHHDSAQEGTNGSPSSRNPVPRQAAIPITRPNKSMRGGSGGGSLSASGLPKLPEQLRNGGKPPKGISCCASCGTTDSAEWRKGESGQKDLCNACGLRYARIVAKQSGKVRARKKKDKNGNDIQPKQLPPSSTTAATSSSNTGRSDSDGSSGQPPAKKARGRGAASTTSPLPPPSVPGPLTDGSNASSSYPGAELTSSSMSYHHSGHPLSNSPYPPSGSYRPSPHHAAFQIAPPPPPPLPPPSSHPNHPYPAALAQPHDSYVPSPHQQQHAAYAQPPPPAHHHPYNEYEAAPGSLYKPYGGGPGGDGGQPHQPHRPHLQQQPHQAGIPPPLQQYPPHPTPPPPPPPLSPHPPHPPHPPPPQQQQQSSYSPYGGGHPNYHPTQPHPQAHRQRQQPLHHSGGYQPPPPPPISNGGGYPTYTNNGNGGGYDRHRLHHQSHSDGGGPGPASHQYPGMGYAQPGYGPGPGSYASGGRGETGPGSAGERAG